MVDGKILVGKWTRLACQRFLDDLKHAKLPRSRWVFDHESAMLPIILASKMVHIKGPLTGQRIQLMPWQKWLLINLFGFIERRTGIRRFRQASIWVPRGNAKSTLAAVLALYVTFSENEGGAEGYSAAVTRAQATIVFEMAKQMTQRNVEFRAKSGVQVNARTLSQRRTGSMFTAISSDAKALDGLNVHFCVLDEIGSHKSAAVYDVLLTAMGKRRQPLMISISTATNNTTGVGRQVWTYTEHVLSKALRDDRFFGVIYAADADDDPWDEKVWRKANPGWGDMVEPEALRSNARQALASPALQAAFKTRHLNIWVQAANALFNMHSWAACTKPQMTLADFEGKPCFIGMDMAARTDLAAVVMVFPIEQDDGDTHYAVFSQAWLPEAAVSQDRNPLYVQWAQDGALTVTEGETVDFDAIELYLTEAPRRFDVRLCGYDPFMLLQLSQRLRNDGYPMEEYRATTLNFSEPTKILDGLMRDHQIMHNGDPVLAWCLGNVVGKYDARANVYPRRESPEKKIDAAIALIIALGASVSRDGGYIYRDHNLLVF